MLDRNIMDPPLIGISENIRKTAELIRTVADTGLNVVITGETGVGKEVVARNLYHLSSRSGKPFIKINCAAVPDGLLESELFGYERGAFTGAHSNREGVFELANGGTLFLDEVGELPLSTQKTFLRVLQEKTYLLY